MFEDTDPVPPERAQLQAEQGEEKGRVGADGEGGREAAEGRGGGRQGAAEVEAVSRNECQSHVHSENREKPPFDRQVASWNTYSSGLLKVSLVKTTFRRCV